ncbi:MAG: UTP--glucose-1-phosphate uridylyltransferase GalU [Nitrospirae bacterium]|nr:MAG: UTP--glucose-1-phosphate uridylyltransferase GalU [Nitrospirota bacterium]
MPSRKVSKAIIPAAGLGTRFLPATKASPKEMLPLVDKPLIQYAVEEAVSAGIQDIIVITGRGKRAIEDHFDVSFELEENLKESGKEKMLNEIRRISELANFCYVRQRHARGLGDAILCAQHLIGKEPFAVILGDEVIDGPAPAIGQLIEWHETLGTPILGVYEVEREAVSSYGIIAAESAGPRLFKVTDLIEKPSLQEAPSRLAVIGRYILPAAIFPVLEKTQPGKHQEIQLTDALRTLARSSPMHALLVHGIRHDAGDKLGFLKATVEFGLKNPELGERFAHYLKGLTL